jgi:hypothetical protein
MTNELQVEFFPKVKSHKMAKLVAGIFFDLIGILSYVFPGFSEIIDLIWAPISGLLLAKMYKGNTGKIAGVLGFLEELIPFTDIIPTFTITWIYTYIIKKEN